MKFKLILFCFWFLCKIVIVLVKIIKSKVCNYIENVDDYNIKFILNLIYSYTYFNKKLI